MWKFIKSHISIDEFKVSALVLAFMGIIALIVYMYITTGDFSNNLLSLVQSLILAIAGVNAVGGVATIVDNMKSRNETNASDGYENNGEVFTRDDEDFRGEDGEPEVKI